MATVGIVNGHNMRLFDGATAIARATECSVSFSGEYRETAHKDTSGGWKTGALGQLSGSGSTNFLFEEVAGGFEDLWTKFLAGTTITLKMTTGVSGDSAFTGDCIITGMEMNAPNNENVTASVAFEFTGAVVHSTVV